MSFSRAYGFHRPKDATPKTWYRISNIAADSVEVTLYDQIGEWGVTASEFISDLQAVDTKSITLRINSPGGAVFDGLAILNSLRSHPATVNVVIDGMAASAASFIAMAGDTVKMSPNSMMMIHEANGFVLGQSADMREMADLLDKTSANIADIYSRHSGRPADEHRAAMRAETWYSDQEAVDAGLADSVIGSTTNKTPVVVNDVPDIIESPVFNWDPEEFRRALREAE